MSTAVVEKEKSPLLVLNDQLEKRAAQFQAALPAHIPVERFKRVILTAVQMNPTLASADRQTLWNSAMRAAQDGLLPDGREAAMVIYKTKMKDANGREFWVDAVQYMPMIAGIRKKVRNSGEIATWDAQVVHEKDHFEFELGDDPYIKHKPFMGGNRGKVIAAYSVATLKTGEKSREVMTVEQIERVRAMSKAKDRGPWVDHYEEMCRKTVARRHSKVLPMSTDLDDLIRRDDDLYDFDAAKAGDKPSRPQLVDFASAAVAVPTQKEQPATETVDQQTGEVVSQPTEPPSGPSGDDDPTDGPSPADAYRLGQEARTAGKALRAVPPEFRSPEMEAFASAWQDGWRARDEEMASEKK